MPRLADGAGRLGGTPDMILGFDAYQLRTSKHPWFAPGLVITKTPQTHLVACTQQHHLMENREVVRSPALNEYRRNPTFARKKEELPDSPNPPSQPANYTPRPATAGSPAQEKEGAAPDAAEGMAHKRWER